MDGMGAWPERRLIPMRNSSTGGPEMPTKAQEDDTPRNLLGMPPKLSVNPRSDLVL